jgi:hypothetical protein
VTVENANEAGRRRDGNGCNPSGRAVTRVVGLIVLGLAAFGVLACTGMGNRLRERERLFAVEMARTQTERGQCAEALTSLDRAQARLDLGLYARESIRARVKCYSKLGLDELARGHRRLLEDFYSVESRTLSDDGGSPVFRARDIDPALLEPVPSILRIEKPRISPSASRSRLVGRVVVAFALGIDGQPTDLRVLEMSHPLLATWAMEAVAGSKVAKSADRSVLIPGRRYVTTFAFESHWEDQPEAEPSGLE